MSYGAWVLITCSGLKNLEKKEQEEYTLSGLS
jgi:hypothetical protein